MGKEMVCVGTYTSTDDLEWVLFSKLILTNVIEIIDPQRDSSIYSEIVHIFTQNFMCHLQRLYH